MDVLIYIGKSALILSLFYFVYATLLKSDTHFTTNRLFLASGFLFSFILPFVQFTKTVTVSIPKTYLANYSEEISPQLAIASQQIDWWYVVGILYFFIVGVLFIRFLKQLFSLLLLIKKHPAIAKNSFKYITIDETILPFSFFNYIVYNPSLHSEEELSMILNHEKVHAYQWHSVDILMANVISLFQWANPIAWLYKKSIEENLEYIADYETASMVSSKRDYQIALVKASSTFKVPALATNFYQSFTKKRIVMLNKSNSKKVNTLKPLTILPLLAIFLWGFNVNEKIHYLETEQPSVVNSIQTNEKDISEEKPITESVDKFDKEKKANIVSSEKRSVSVQQDSVKGFQIRITKNTTVEELEAYKQKLKKEHNASFNYNNLNFNSKGEITGISISYSDTRGNNNNYSVSSGQPINDFVLAVSENGSISSRTVLTEEQEMQRQKMMAERDKMISERKKEIEERKEVIKEQMQERKEVMKERMEKQKERVKMIRAQMKDSATVFITADTLYYKNPNSLYSNNASESDGPIIFIDGKETSEKALKSVSPGDIEKVNVLKGKKAIKKYGVKGAKGIIEITTKQ
tara:strand:+ start:6 stop:1739 length:1734 start_codon:yes stop_codon:yes gene_type:complete